jgi:uncharacterized membrane protein
MELGSTVTHIGEIVEIVGVAVIIIGLIFAAVYAVVSYLKTKDAMACYKMARQGFGRTLLLGLEILVAGDIIATVALSLDRDNLVNLAILVAVRTFLSWTLEVEIEGHWPWQGQEKADQSA